MDEQSTLLGVSLPVKPRHGVRVNVAGITAKPAPVWPEPAGIVITATARADRVGSGANGTGEYLDNMAKVSEENVHARQVAHWGQRPRKRSSSSRARPIPTGTIYAGA